MNSPSWSWKSSDTSLATSRTRDGPYVVGGPTPRTSETNAADSFLSRTHRMVWFSFTGMAASVPARSCREGTAHSTRFNEPVTHTHDEPALNPALEKIGWLVGTWWGFGVGGYPTIEAFRYEQELTFTHDGRPFLAYESKAWLIDDDGNRIKP